ncbi:MAG: hypothetical protein KAV82_01010 [Phycisphaerae bacterium]|nr:hypothetical protein [Phycisphaerae bacterium]
MLEVSWDGGENWYQIATNEFTTIPSIGAVRITKQNLLEFGREVLDRIEEEAGGKPVRNYYHAYLLRQFRIRVTALVDLDDRVAGEALDPWTVMGRVGPLGTLSASQTVLRAGEFGAVDTQRFTDHDFVANGDSDDASKAGDCAWGVLQHHVAPKTSASPVMPWLDIPDRYSIGMPIGGIRRSALNTDNDLTFTAWLGPGGLRPEVVGKIYRQNVEGASTELILEDYTYATPYRG